MSSRNDIPDPLPRDFYARDVREVARDLLGCSLVHHGVGGRIVEVEAYGGPGDPGSHADRAPNGRARIMFGPPGIAYVYFTYGMHFCMNAVADVEGRGSGVLIRALEPVWGLDVMRERTPTDLADGLLASGPGRLCRALAVDRACNGVDLTSSALRICEPVRAAREVRSGVRVGLRVDDGREWRYWTPSASVSKGRPGPGRRSGRAAP